MDDTIREGHQAHEDVWNAMVEAGMLPGHVHFPLETQEDLEKFYAKVGKGDLFVYRVVKEASDFGLVGGIAAAALIHGIPEKSWGKTILAFDGYADDPRELFQIPTVVSFCRGLLLGPVESMYREHAKRTADVLYNEALRGGLTKFGINPKMFDVSGIIWLISIAFHDKCYSHSSSSPSGWKRDLRTNLGILHWVMEESHQA